MLACIERFFTELRKGEPNGLKRLDYAPEKVYNMLIRRVNDPTYFCHVLMDGDEVVGGMSGGIMSPFYTTDRIAYDEILYLKPERTHATLVIRLVKTYLKWAKDSGAIEVRLCNSTGQNFEGFSKLCNRLGMTQFEIGFMMRN
jgi:hypothetical protein